MEQTITLTLNPVHLDTIARGLAELPFKVAAPVIQEVQKQINVAQEAAKAAVSTAKAAEETPSGE